MIHEMLMDQGSFDVTFVPAMPWDIMTSIAEFGHIVVLPQHIDPRLVSNADILDAARYSGVVLQLDYQDYDLRVSGAGMAWWLGDGLGHGELTATTDDFDDTNWQTALNQVLPAAITAGTYTDPTYTTVRMIEPFETPLNFVRMMMAQIGGEWRINPDGTIDAGAPATVFNTADADVRIVVTRGDTGDDGYYTGIPLRTIQTTVDGMRYVTGILFNVTNTATAYDPRWNTLSTITTTNRSPIPYKDIHGNAMVRQAESSRVVANSGTEGTYLAYPSRMDDIVLAEKDVQHRVRFTTDHYQLFGKDCAVGDAVWCYDPPIVRDTANQIYYRGDVIEPVKLRITEASWPLREGMGVFYRSAAGVYTDLTRWVQWEESQPTSVTVTIPDYDTPIPVYHMPGGG